MQNFWSFVLKVHEHIQGDFQMYQFTAKGDQAKVLDVQLQVYIISFFPGKLLSVDSFQKLNFCIS